MGMHNPGTEQNVTYLNLTDVLWWWLQEQVLGYIHLQCGWLLADIDLFARPHAHLLG